MNAVGIDVSKGKSMVAALRPMGEVALLPQEFLHTEVGLEQMAYAIVALGEDTRVIMEATGRYHEPIAAALHEYGIYVCVLNPLFIKQSGGGSIRKVKTDKADAMKIAKYGLDNWVELREYTPMDTAGYRAELNPPTISSRLAMRFFSSLFCYALFRSRKLCGTFFVFSIDFCLQDSDLLFLWDIGDFDVVPKSFHDFNESLVHNPVFLLDDSVDILSRSPNLFCNGLLCHTLFNTFDLYIEFNIIAYHSASSFSL